jgi:hypothetical protein
MDITWELANIIAPKEIAERYTYNKHGKHRFRREDSPARVRTKQNEPDL